MSPLNITQPWMVYGIYGLLDGDFFRWCPIFPKWDSYQPLIDIHWLRYPLVMTNITMERSTIFLWENPLFLWPFLISMLVYQRVHWYPGWYQWYPSKTSEVHWYPSKTIFPKEIIWFADLCTVISRMISRMIAMSPRLTTGDIMGYTICFFKWEIPSTGDICHHMISSVPLDENDSKFRGSCARGWGTAQAKLGECFCDPMPWTRPIIWG